MKTGRTSNGFEYQIEDERLDDYELLEMLAAADEGEPQVIIKVAPKLLGEEQTKRLKEHIRTESGIVPASKMFEMIGEILTGSQAGKN